MAEGRLAEVEEDAMYITNKRFQDQQEDHVRAVAKAARDEAKANKAGAGVQSLAPAPVTEDKKGKE